MMVAELKTAAEVRAHYRKMQRRINRQLHHSIPAPPAPKPVVELLSPEEARQLQAVHAPTARPIRTILELTALHFKQLTNALYAPDHSPHFVLPRYVAFFIARKFGAPWTLISKVARRDHSTVAHGCASIERRIMLGDAEIIEAVESVGRQAAERFGLQLASVK